MNRVGYVAAALVAALTSLALTGHAFTLGELRGSAIVGRSLDVSVSVQTGTGEDAAASCISAEVYHADVLQPAPTLSVTSGGSAAVPTPMVRIQSRVPVDEPVVTLVVRSTCGSPTTRRYVVLADFPTVVLPLAAAEAASVAPQVSGPVVPVAALPPPLTASEPILVKAPVIVPATPGAPAASPGIPAKTVKAVKPTPPKKTPSLQVAPSPRPAPERVPGKATLKLDPLELPATVSPGPLAPASAAVSAPSDDALLMAKQLAAMQDEIKAMRALALKNDASVLELRAQLLQAQSDRVPASWVYLLLALLFSSLAAVGWLVWQQRRANARAEAWWQRPQDAPTDTVLAPSPVVPVSPARTPVVPAGRVRESTAVATGTAQPAAPSSADLNLDIDLDSLHAMDNGEADAQLTQVLEFAPKEVATSRHSISIEPILDIRQQAEFFVSLGQTERALRLLKKQIAESSEPNPFVYLDLLELYHSLGLKSEFREYRTAFNQYFNGLVPDFPAFHAAGKDLLAYPEALARLMECWPSSEAMAFMDACIFRDAQATAQPSFDLPAFRDLLMLHAIAETMPTSAPWNATRRASLDAAAPDTEILPDAVPGDSASGIAIEPQQRDQSPLSFEPSDWQIRQAKETPETPSKMLDLDFSTFSPAAESPVQPVEPRKTDSNSPTVPGQF